MDALLFTWERAVSTAAEKLQGPPQCRIAPFLWRERAAGRMACSNEDQLKSCTWARLPKQAAAAAPRMP